VTSLSHIQEIADSAGQVPASTLQRLREAGRPLVLAPGEILFVLGDAASDMYLIESGSVDLFFEPGKPPKRLGEGAFFGELAFIIGNHRRTATAIVGSQGVSLRVLDQDTLQRLLEQAAADLFALVRYTSAYLVASEGRLIKELWQRNKELEVALDHGGVLREEFCCYRDVGLVDRSSGLFTRRCILAYLDKLAAEGRLDGKRALLLIALPGLEGLGERLGEGFRRKGLEWAANGIRQVLRPDDLPFRIDRTRFGILLKDAEPSLALGLAQTLHEVLQRGRIRLPDQTLEMPVYIGGASAGVEQNGEVLFQRAAAALERAILGGGEPIAWGGGLEP
jgi:diguanylate cyclase